MGTPFSKVFQSSYLQHGVYDPLACSLTVTFTNGVTYRSTVRVPPEAWDGLAAATSPGQYFRDNIASFWIGEEVKPADE